jgi:hypothetical protein
MRLYLRKITAMFAIILVARINRREKGLSFAPGILLNFHMSEKPGNPGPVNIAKPLRKGT